MQPLPDDTVDPLQCSDGIVYLTAGTDEHYRRLTVLMDQPELFTDPPELKPYPGEEGLLSAGAVDKRRREFVGARHCARQALAELGEPPAAILRGERGMPVFPKGVVGSLTHCDGYRAAALGHTLAVRSVGIDAEPHGPLPDGVLGEVSLRAEREELADNSGEWHLDRLLFCAKEATYKAWFPLTRRWLGFEDALITFDLTAHTFHSELLVPGGVLDGGPPLREFHGRWTIRDGLILTAIVVT